MAIGLVKAETPPKKWHPQQFFLENPDLGWKYLLKRERFPGGLMLRQDNAWRRGDMLGADDLIADAADEPKQKQHHVSPAGSNAIAPNRWKGKRSQYDEKVKRGDDNLQQTV